MSIPRITTIALTMSVVALVTVNAFVFAQGQLSTTAPGGVHSATGWQRWLTLSPTERLAYVRQYEAIARRPDARKVFRQAREFSGLTPVAQERVRSLLQLMWETLDEHSPGQRRELLCSSQRARAFLVYQTLLSKAPEKIADLRREARRAP